MATHRPPHSSVRPKAARKRLVEAVRTALVALGVLGVLVAMTPGTAAADPKPDMNTVEKKVDSLNVKVDKVTEQYNQARIHLTSAKKRATHLEKRVEAQKKHVSKLRRTIASLATSAYMSGGSNLASLMTTDNPQDFIDKATSLQQLSSQDSRRIDKFKRAAKTLASKQGAAKKAVKQTKGIKKKLAGKKSTIEKSLNKQQDLLSQLRASARADRASRSNDRAAAPEPSNLPSASGTAAQAIAFAKAQLGKPYSWGAAGPDAYDCSGLTMAAYQAAGVSLPHSSQAQMGSGPSVPRSALQPGDLVFFGSPVHHVGIYVGGGQMINAPNSGEVVQYASLNESYWASTYAGAVRPS
ncbi:MAG: NlpC/P60 family protein [Streptosporangiales bacterium]